MLESNDLTVRICYQCKIHSFLQRKLMICARSLMVVHSQPVCPPSLPHISSPDFGMSASTELLSFYSSMKKLRDYNYQ